MERLKEARTRLVLQYDLAPGVLCPNWLLEAIARTSPRDLEELAAVDGVRRWQVKEFGKDLLVAVT